MHLKRHEVPKSWTIPRKGTKYIVRPSFNNENGVPLLVVLRDILQIAENRKEVKRMIHLKYVMLSGRSPSDEKNNAQLFDTLTIIPSKKNYRVEISEKGKFVLTEIKESERNHKVVKLIGKKILKNKKTQLNCSDGRNFISDLKCKVGDSIYVNLKEKKIEKCLPLVEEANVVVFSGKHAGRNGVLKKIEKERGLAEVEIDKKRVNVLIKQIIVTKQNEK